MENEIVQIASRIRELREILEIPSSVLAAELGISSEEYGEYESGRKDIPISALYAIAHKLGYTAKEIQQGFDALELTAHRLQIRIIRDALIIDDSYNASPDASIAALNLLGEMSGRRIAVLGEMRELGQDEKKGHQMVGDKAAETCDELIAVGPVTKYIAEAAAANGMKSEKIHWFETVPEAIGFLQNGYCTADDVLLIKGSLAMGMSRIVSVLEEQK